jgi:hypothetical protein
LREWVTRLVGAPGSRPHVARLVGARGFSITACVTLGDRPIAD